MVTTDSSVAVRSCAGNDAAIYRTTSHCRQIPVLHSFGYRSCERYAGTNTRIQKYIFSGGRLPSAAALRLTHERFPQRRNHLSRWGFDEVFERMSESHPRGSR